MWVLEAIGIVLLIVIYFQVTQISEKLDNSNVRLGSNSDPMCGCDTTKPNYGWCISNCLSTPTLLSNNQCTGSTVPMPGGGCAVPVRLDAPTGPMQTTGLLPWSGSVTVSQFSTAPQLTTIPTPSASLFLNYTHNGNNIRFSGSVQLQNASLVYQKSNGNFANDQYTHVVSCQVPSVVLDLDDSSSYAVGLSSRASISGRYVLTAAGTPWSFSFAKIKALHNISTGEIDLSRVKVIDVTQVASTSGGTSVAVSPTVPSILFSTMVNNNVLAKIVQSALWTVQFPPAKL